MANLMIPVTVVPGSGRVAHITISMTEAEARAVVNMDTELAWNYGEFFVVVRNSLTEFLEREG
jgi:hypothetical protein